MKKYYTINKNKAFIFLQVIIISFLFISLTLFIQILLNSRFNLYKTDVKTQENFQDYDFLDEIIKQEFKNIEEKINNREIKDAIGYIVLSENGEKIFLINDYNKRISFGGYRLLEDEKGKNYYNYLKDKIKEYKYNLNFDDSQIFELYINAFNSREISELLEIKQKKVEYKILKIKQDLLKEDIKN